MIMLSIQYNCRRRYKNIVIVIEIAFSIGAGLVILQELFIGNQELDHSAFNFY